MKRTLRLIASALILIILSTVVLTSCGGSDKLVGKWTASMMGVETMAFEFTEDGKMIISTMGIVSAEAEYKVKGNTLTYTIGDQKTKTDFTLDGDKLTLDFGGTSYTLDKAE